MSECPFGRVRTGCKCCALQLDLAFNGNELGFVGSANGQLSAAVARKLTLDTVDDIFTEDIPISAVAEWSDGGSDGGRSKAEVSLTSLQAELGEVHVSP